MDRPDWKDAPEWARYLGRDNNGMFCWFENEPVCKKGEFFPQGGQYDMPTTIEPELTLIPRDACAERAARGVNPDQTPMAFDWLAHA